MATQRKGVEAAVFNSELETDMDLISLIDISKYYQMGGQTVKALDSVTVHIAKNDYLAFIGSSGSGKSTMLNILGCIDRPSTGTYHLNGKDVDSLTENELSEIRNLEIGFIFQSFNLLPRIFSSSPFVSPIFFVACLQKARLIRPSCRYWWNTKPRAMPSCAYFWRRYLEYSR